MKWFLYRGFPSLILDALNDSRSPPDEEIKDLIRRSVSEYPGDTNRELMPFFGDELSLGEKTILPNELTDVLQHIN